MKFFKFHSEAALSICRARSQVSFSYNFNQNLGALILTHQSTKSIENHVKFNMPPYFNHRRCRYDWS